MRTLPIPASIVMDQPDPPFHDDAVVKALRRQKAAPIWFKLPVPPPHGLTLRDIIDDQAQEWDTSAKTAEIVSKMEKPHLDRLDEDKRAGGLVIRSLNYRTRNGIPQWEVSRRPDRQLPANGQRRLKRPASHVRGRPFGMHSKDNAHRICQGDGPAGILPAALGPRRDLRFDWRRRFSAGDPAPGAVHLRAAPRADTRGRGAFRLRAAF